jgi:predicted RNA-binding Zn ribbon-like protein
MTTLPDPAFSLCGGHPALDLVNSLDNRFRADGPTELLRDHTALLAFMEQSGLLDRATSQMLAQHASKTDEQRVVAAARDLREATASVLYAVVQHAVPPTAALQTLERHSQEARQHQQILWTATAAGPKFVWGWRAPQLEPDLPVWMLSLQASALLTSAELSRLRTCQCETCRWLFLDTSKNHTRRWCDMQVCGNRMKARRFQARRM